MQANRGSAHVLFEIYKEGVEVTLDFGATRDASLHVELLSDNGVHNRLFQALPAPDRQVRFLLLPNANAKTHKKHDVRAALTYEGLWESPLTTCRMASWPPPTLPPRPSSTELAPSLEADHPYAPCKTAAFVVDNDWGAGFRAIITFQRWMVGGLVALPLHSAAGVLERTVGVELETQNASHLIFKLMERDPRATVGGAGSLAFSLKGSVASALGNGAQTAVLTLSSFLCTSRATALNSPVLVSCSSMQLR